MVGSLFWLFVLFCSVSVCRCVHMSVSICVCVSLCLCGRVRVCQLGGSTNSSGMTRDSKRWRWCLMHHKHKHKRKHIKEATIGQKLTQMLKAAYPLVHSCPRLRCARISFINQFNIILVWCIHYCASALASDALALVSTLLTV